MTALPKAPTIDFLAPSLAASISDSATSFDVDDASRIQTPTYATIDRVDANGTKTPDKREVIYISSKSTNTLTVTRGVNNSTARSHSAGAKLEPVLSVGQWADLYSWATADHVAADGSHDISKIAVLSGATIQTLAGKILSSPTITSPTVTSLLGSTATINTLYVPTYFSASGASINGIYPSGASGSVLTNNSPFPPVFAPAASTSRTRSVWMPANIFQSAEGSPTLSAGSNADTPSAWLLDDAAVVESVAGQVIIPEDWSSGAVTVKLYFAMVSATSGNVQVDSRILSVASNADALGAGTSSSDTIAVPGTAGLLKIATRGSTFTPGGAGEMVRVSVRRLGSNGSDTATGDMRFFGVKLEYTAIL